VINTPQGLRDLSEKLAILEFPEFIPAASCCATSATCATPSRARRPDDHQAGLRLRRPRGAHRPRGRSQPQHVVRAGDPRRHDLDDRPGLRSCGKDGDKRILLVDGEPIGAVMRVPASGEIRNNFHAGGSPAATALTPATCRSAPRVGPFLRERGQFFVGLDVLGDYLTEINVTSPTGMQEINRLENLTDDATMQAKFWTALADQAALGGARGLKWC
jgi:glutathione synthase